MIGIGNEQWDKVYTERLEVFTKAIRAHYPDIKIVGSSGPTPMVTSSTTSGPR